MKLKTEALVLVVDDVAQDRMLARAFLEKLGWRVHEAASGLAAVEELNKMLPSHILLDVKMPGFDGMSVARHVRNAMGNRMTRIVGYTAHASQDDARKLMTLGFDAVLLKPICFADISREFSRSGGIS